jgi:formate hydrogenlyase transcriptional activator
MSLASNDNSSPGNIRNGAEKLSAPKNPYSTDNIAGFEKLLFQILTKFTGLIIDNFEAEIEAALKLVVEYLDVDRGMLCEFIDDEDTLKILVFYAQPGAPAPYMTKIGDKIPQYATGIKNGEVMLFSRVDDMPEKYFLEKAHAKATKLKSTVGLPIKVGGSFMGTLAFDMYSEERSWPTVLLGKLKILTEIFGNVLARKRSYDKQKNMLQLENLISSISTKFLHMPADRIDDEIESSLKDIVLHLGVDRSSLFQLQSNNAEEAPEFKLTHLWRRIQDDSDDKVLSGSHYPWIMKKVLKKKFFSFSHIDEIPEQASVDRESLIKTSTRSNMSLPLVINGRVAGLLAFGSTQKERKWSPDIISRAKVIAQIFTNVLARKEADVRLTHAYREIKKFKERAENENIYLRSEIELHDQHKEIFGRSFAVRNILDQAKRVAKTNTTVLILGETGTGKDLLAHEIHKIGLRKDRPLIKVNCAALPGSLMESELFGYEKGAFTGAMTRKLGRFEIAHGSTLFLDEIGEIPLGLQAKLLRVLQEGRFERIGGTKTVEVDVRIITATNRNLSEEVRQGKFRQDLYYRLKVFPIWIPPLRDRVEDIPELAMKFIDEYTRSMGKNIENIPRKAMEMLQVYLWPGNVRELKNVIEHAMILSDGKTLDIQVPQNTESDLFDNDSLEENERKYIIKVLEQTGWRVKGKMGAAEILQINPSTLFFRMKKLGISRNPSANGY